MLGKKLICGTAVLIGALLAAGCEEETSQTKLQYMPDMADTPVAKAQRSYIDPPENSVAVTAILYPEQVEVAEREFKNPLPASQANLDEGKVLYETYCTVCHGADGKGQGTLGASYPIGVPDISRPDLATRKDGYFFMQISKGGPMMPSYGHSTDANERWKIILFLRTLQNQNG